MKVSADIRICGDDRMDGVRYSEMYFCLRTYGVTVCERFHFVDFIWGVEKCFFEKLFYGRANFVVLNETDSFFFFEKDDAEKFMEEERYEDGKKRYQHIISIDSFFNILLSKKKGKTPLTLYDSVMTCMCR